MQKQFKSIFVNGYNNRGGTKFLALIVALVLVFSLVNTVYAESGDDLIGTWERFGDGAEGTRVTVTKSGNYYRAVLDEATGTLIGLGFLKGDLKWKDVSYQSDGTYVGYDLFRFEYGGYEYRNSRLVIGNDGILKLYVADSGTAEVIIGIYQTWEKISSQTSAAENLEILGILKGTGNGVDDAYRASLPTRYQAAWLFLRLLGRENAAKAFIGSANFADYATAKTASGNLLALANQTMLAYLYVSQSLGFRGYPDNTFRPFLSVNEQMYCKLMLVALGYVENMDFTWNNVFDKVVEFGLTTEKPANSGVFNIDGLAEITVQALKAKLKDGTMTLAEKLVEVDRSISMEAAQRAGVYTP